jgi:hypothetical protein
MIERRKEILCTDALGINCHSCNPNMDRRESVNRYPGGWVAFDLDGTLAVYEAWGDGDIGDPVLEMVVLAKRYLYAGNDVRIFTARVSNDPDGKHRLAIEDWTEKHIGVRLPVTNVKDYGMLFLFDDRAISVERNTGRQCKCVPH